jgi:hypothetical protein
MSWINCACALVPKSTPHQAQSLIRCYAHAINGPMSDLPQGLVMAISQSSIPEFSASTNSSLLDCGHSFQQLADPSLISLQGRQKFRPNPPTIFTSSASVEPNQDDWCSKQQQWWNQQQCHQLTNTGALPAKRLVQHIQRLAVKAAAEPAMQVPAV